jgi:histidinol phosphatase-like PHP family hydrolase
MKITHDLHIHTGLSLCAERDATAEGYLAVAKRIGLTKIGFSDHYWDEHVKSPCNTCREGVDDFYLPQNTAHVESLRPQLDALRGQGVEILFGCETEYDPCRHGVAISEEVAERMDFILVPNSHTHMVMPKDLYEPYEKHANYMVNAYREIIESPVSRYITSMAHPFEAVCCPYDNRILIKLIPDDEYRRLFDRTAEKGIAYEINVSCWLKKTHAEIEADPVLHLFRLAKECGCRFTFGSDAHSHTAHDVYMDQTSFIADLLSLKEDDLAPITR